MIVVNSLNNFANISLSTFYFDITKDSLYADGKESVERRAVLTVLEQVDLGSLPFFQLCSLCDFIGPNNYDSCLRSYSSALS
jgi:hypothetical protein